MNTRLYTILVVLLFVVAGFFATYHLKESPPVWYDEGMFTQAAANLATYGQTGLRVAPDTIEPSSKLITVGYPLIYPLAGWFKAFGVSVLSARSLMVLFILGFLLAGYFLVKRLFGPGLALGALALLATLPTLYGNGKSVLGEVPGLMYLVLSLLFLTIALSSTTRKYLWFVLAGLLAGLCVATKPTFLLLIPAIAVGVFIEWRRKTLSIREILIAAGVGVIPLFLWLLLQFQGGDSLASILSYYANPYQLPNLSEVILGNIQRLFIGIGPLYLMGVMGVWVCALWIRLRRREAIHIAEIVALGFSLLIIVAYLRTAGWYRYLFEAQVLSLLFFPNSLLIVVRATTSLFNPGKMVLLAVIALTLIGAYQVMFSSFVAESYNRNKTAFLEAHFATVLPTTSVFFYNVPEAALFIHSDNYYQYFDPAGWYIGKEQLPVITEGKVDEIILRTDAYTNMEKDHFQLYKVSTTTHDYTIFEKI
ncbi:MAG TPA: glycosyltransferase family 39 protein [Candidatus Paceibacterota bacterium]